MKNWKDDIYFVLVEPKEPGNIGAAARAIKNMGFSRLSLVNPPSMTDEARWMAHNALDVLDEAETHKSVKDVAKDMSIVIGTTARRGKRRGLILPLDEGIGRFMTVIGQGKTAILFGRESRGLFNEEVEECGFMLTIPSSARQPSLNLGQAVMVVAYELSKTGGGLGASEQGRKKKRYESLGLVRHEEVDLLYEKITESLKLLDYIPRGDRDLEKKIMSNLKHFIGRAGLTDWELNMLHGIITQARITLEKH